MKCPLTQKDCDIECAWLCTSGINKACSVAVLAPIGARDLTIPACFVNDVPVDHAGNPLERDDR